MPDPEEFGDLRLEGPCLFEGQERKGSDIGNSWRVCHGLLTVERFRVIAGHDVLPRQWNKGTAKDTSARNYRISSSPEQAL